MSLQSQPSEKEAFSESRRRRAVISTQRIGPYHTHHTHTACLDPLAVGQAPTD